MMPRICGLPKPATGAAGGAFRPPPFDAERKGQPRLVGVIAGFNPFATAEAVDIVVEVAPALNETKENAEEYFEVHPDAPSREGYTLETENLDDKTWLYKWFWGLFE